MVNARGSWIIPVCSLFLLMICLLIWALPCNSQDVAEPVSVSTVIDGKSFENLSTAIARIGAKKVTLQISNRLNANSMTIPQNIRLKLINDGIIHVDSDQKLTIHGDIDAPLKKIFDGAGEIYGVKIARPQWFGATGLNDDTVAIQKAIDSLEPGGKLQLDDLSFISAGNIITKSDLTIEGNGTIVKKANTKSNLLFIKNASNVEVQGIKLDGERNKQTMKGYNLALIYVEACSHVLLASLDIRNGQGSGITSFRSTDSIFSGNVLVNNYDNGIIAGGRGARDIQIVDNYVDTTTKQDGIFITASFGSVASAEEIYRIEVRNNTVKNAGDSGIELGQNCNDCIVSGNKVLNSKMFNILVRDVRNCQVTGNRVNGNSGKEVYAKTGIAVVPLTREVYEYNLAVANNFINAEGFGIDIRTSGVSVSGNTIIGKGSGHGGSRGIRAFKELNTVEGNTIDGFETGIIVGETNNGEAVADVQIKDNSIANVKVGITGWLHPLRNVLVSNNTITDHSGYAIRFDSCTDGNEFIVIDNKVSNPAKKYSGLKPQRLN